MAGKHIQFEHRLVFVGAWALLGAALVLLGEPIRAFIIGIPLLGRLAEALFGDADKYNSHGALLLIIFAGALLSGLAVGLCAWAMERARLTRKIWAVLLLMIFTGAASIHRVFEYSYEDWLSSPEVSAAAASPELDYTPTRADFMMDVAVPKTLVGGIWGLYAASALCAAYACARILAALAAGRMPRHRPLSQPAGN